MFFKFDNLFLRIILHGKVLVLFFMYIFAGRVSLLLRGGGMGKQMFDLHRISGFIQFDPG